MSKVYGLTGGIASGKSTVASLFAQQGAVVVDADQVAREVVLPGSQGLDAVVAAFGDDILDGRGALDRAKLGQKVFDSEEDRATLNRILHPLIAEESMRRMAAAMAAGAPLVLYEAALLVETGRYKDFPGLIVVAATLDRQRERIMRRDSLSADEANARIASQLPLEDKLKVADHVIHNDGSLDDLSAQVSRVYNAIVPTQETRA